MLDLLDKCYAAYELALAPRHARRQPLVRHRPPVRAVRRADAAVRRAARLPPSRRSHVLEIDAAFEKRREICYRLGLIFKQQSDSQRALGCFAAIAEDPPEPLQIADVWFQIGHVHESVEPMNAPLAKEAYEYVPALLAFSDSYSHIPTHIPTRLPTQVRAPAARRGGAAQEGARVPPARLALPRHPPALGPVAARPPAHGGGRRRRRRPELALARPLPHPARPARVGVRRAAARDSDRRARPRDLAAPAPWRHALPDARIAYHRAVLLNPLSEAWLQLGHVLEAMHALRSTPPSPTRRRTRLRRRCRCCAARARDPQRDADLAVMRGDSRRRAAARARPAPRERRKRWRRGGGSGGGGGGGGGTPAAAAASTAASGAGPNSSPRLRPPPRPPPQEALPSPAPRSLRSTLACHPDDGRRKRRRK